MNKKQLIVVLVMGILLSGCATLNFSSKYYTLPYDYKKDIDEVWNDIISKIPLKYKNLYSYKITKDYETSTAGVPQIYEWIVSLPEYFIKYIWEFYYPDYHKAILTCVILHEFAHPEGEISSTPPYEHHRCDSYATDLLYTHEEGKLTFPYNFNHFYSSLIVTQQYWSARKGIGGHLFNIGWNAINLYAIALGGSGTVGDWFATDISERLSLFKSLYPSATFVFKRSKSPKTVNYSEPPYFESEFLTQKSQKMTENNYPDEKITSTYIDIKKAEGQVDRFKGKTEKEIEAILGKPISKRRISGGGFLRQYKTQEGTITIFFDNLGIVSGWTK